MKLIEPYLKHRETGRKPFYNDFYNDIEKAFSIGYSSTSVHFFTTDKILKNIVWKKYVSSEPFNEDDLIDYFNKNNFILNMKEEIQFFEYQGLSLQLIIFYDDVDWVNENPNIFIVNFFLNQSYQIQTSITTERKHDFENRLLEIQDGPTPMNKKLIYSTTKLEGYLSDKCFKNYSNTCKAIFPGDVDLILFENNTPQLLIEFKKHTKWGRKRFVDQSYKTYWELDKKKYNGIALLSNKLGLDKFYNVIYSTVENEKKKLKIEQISSKNLNLIKELHYELANIKELESIIRQLI